MFSATDDRYRCDRVEFPRTDRTGRSKGGDPPESLGFLELSHDFLSSAFQYVPTADPRTSRSRL
jgi:hypothetical protein